MRYIDDIEIKKPKITIGTHFFTLNDAQGKIASIASQYAKQFLHLGLAAKQTPGKPRVMEVKARFYSFIPLKNEFRFSIEQLDGLLDAFEKQFIGPADIDIVENQYTIAPECRIKLKEGWTLRDYQIAVKEFILNKDASISRSRLASLPTGTGKTVIALSTAVELNCRIGIPVPAGYAAKWKSDVLEQYDIPEDDIYEVDGRPALLRAIKRAKEGVFYKVYIFNQETLASFYKEYETAYFDGFEDHYGVLPDKIFETLGIGVNIIDETHEALSMVFKMFLYTNVPLVIGLSGTLRARDQFILRIQRLIYPLEVRFESVKMKRYIDFRPTSYTFANLKAAKLKMSYNGNMYSQAAFETSIYNNKNKNILRNFLKMIDHYFTTDFLERKKDGEKGALYFARIEMCELVRKFLKIKHPDIDIRKYTGTDPYENATESEVRVTTRGSCGTAIDIKGLVSLITFDNVDSDIGNLQLLGRLRENKTTDTVPRFRQLYCNLIPKHVGYQKTRHQTFADRIASCSYERYTQPLDIDPDKPETLDSYR